MDLFRSYAASSSRVDFSLASWISINLSLTFTQFITCFKPLMKVLMAKSSKCAKSIRLFPFLTVQMNRPSKYPQYCNNYTIFSRWLIYESPRSQLLYSEEFGSVYYFWPEDKASMFQVLLYTSLVTSSLSSAASSLSSDIFVCIE